MNNESDRKAWGQLVSITHLEKPVIPLLNNKFVIGRNSDCDLPHIGNKLVSGKHCYIEKANDGTVWLHDTSTNGTLLNLSIKLLKGEQRELHHGDEIHIVHKKIDTKDDIGYLFQDIDALNNEPSSEDTEEYTFTHDSTVIDDAVSLVSTLSTAKRQIYEQLSEVICKKSKTEDQNLSSQSDSALKVASNPESTVESHTKHPANDKAESTSKNEKPGQTKNLPLAADDAIAETLVCSICHELLHDCISLQPCMHSYCSGCYSDWMDLSDECPSCRLKVERINKNHIVNNLIEAYLKVKPEKKRPSEELNELDMKNKITRDMLYPKKKEQQSFEDSSDFETTPSQSQENDLTPVGAFDNPFVFGALNNPVYTPGPIYPGANPTGLLFGAGTPFFGVTTTRAAQPVCRQCPNYVNYLTIPTTVVPAAVGSNTIGDITPGPSTGQGSSTAADPDDKTYPPIPQYTCPPGGNHVLCLCCMLPMPDRRNNPNIPPQSCGICLRAFCHAYWGCQTADCHGCLGKFKDMNFGKKCLTTLILDNHYESQVLVDYMKTKSLTVKDVLAACLAKMVAGDYVCTNQGSLVNKDGINTPVCYACGLRNFKDLAYFYRRDIPQDELPDDVKSRPNCYWGKNCRTQRNKPDHSKRFNHICEQSRTM